MSEQRRYKLRDILALDLDPEDKELFKGSKNGALESQELLFLIKGACLFEDEGVTMANLVKIIKWANEAKFNFALFNTAITGCAYLGWRDNELMVRPNKERLEAVREEIAEQFGGVDHA